MAGPKDDAAVDAAADEDPNSATGFASPPCFMHELDPSYLGFATPAEVLALLNELLEGERAGARGVGALSRWPDERHPAAMQAVARDEARFCAMLSGHIKRLGGTLSTRTGGFYQKLLALETAEARLALLDRGQGWVVRKLDDFLPRIGDDLLHRDLKEMREVHISNIERCKTLQA
jgi:hypothetical protein